MPTPPSEPPADYREPIRYREDRAAEREPIRPREPGPLAAARDRYDRDRDHAGPTLRDRLARERAERLARERGETPRDRVEPPREAAYVPRGERETAPYANREHDYDRDARHRAPRRPKTRTIMTSTRMRTSSATPSSTTATRTSSAARST